MDAEVRRKGIVTTVSQSEAPVSAAVLAKEFEVSRQVIVGDVALLRAQGQDIIATARGYVLQKSSETHQFLGKIACHHTPENAQSELYTIVDLDAKVIDVVVEHEVYGEITGSLNLTSRADVDTFLSKLNSRSIKLLSELTMGTHLHTIACRDKKHFDKVVQALELGGYLYAN